MKNKNKKSNWIIIFIYIVGIVIALITLLKTPLPAIIIGTILIVFGLILLIVRIIIPGQKKKKIKSGVALFLTILLANIAILLTFFLLFFVYSEYDYVFDPYSECTGFSHTCIFSISNLPNMSCTSDIDCSLEYGDGHCDLNSFKCGQTYLDGSKKACTDMDGEWTRYKRSCWIE